MTANDCYELALILYKQEDPNINRQAAEWFEAALEKFNNEQNENTFTAIEVMTYIVKSYHQSNINLGWLLLNDRKIEVSRHFVMTLKIVYQILFFLGRHKSLRVGRKTTCFKT